MYIKIFSVFISFFEKHSICFKHTCPQFGNYYDNVMRYIQVRVYKASEINRTLLSRSIYLLVALLILLLSKEH